MMMVALLSWCRDVFMAIMVCVPCPLVFEVLLMVPGAVVLMGGWLRLCHLGCILSEPFVDHCLLLHSINIHIMDRR